MKSFISFVICLLIPFAAAFVGSKYMPGEWYENLVKPSWNPPNYLFGPVWTVLYLSMGISLWLNVKSYSLTELKIPLTLFIIQLILNAIWSYLFFGLKNPELAFYELVILWVFIGGTIFSFYRFNAISGLILIPYFLWVTFAGYLNFTLWRLNI